MNDVVVITGANRGIGFELARQWRQQGKTVLAACRQRSDTLDNLDVEVVDGVDVTRDDAPDRLRSALAGRPVSMLFNNAGLLCNEDLDNMNVPQIQRQLEINALGPLRITHGLLDHLGDGSKVGLMTSRMGSMADNTSGGRYGYRMSKAALNAAGKSLAIDLAPRGIAVAILHPGWVKTEMTGHTGHLSAAEAALALVQRMADLTLDNSGTFWHADGSELPW